MAKLNLPPNGEYHKSIEYNGFTQLWLKNEE